MKNTEDELTDAQIDAIADEGERLLERRGNRAKLPMILRGLLVIAGTALFWCFFLWWQANSFEIWHLWDWASP